MINKLFGTIMDADNRYLTAGEYDQILQTAQQLPALIAAAQAVEAVEAEVSKQAVDTIRGLYPDFERTHNYAWSKCQRDVQLVMRHQVQAMLMGDVSVLDEKVLFWLRTIFSSFTFESRLCADTYGTLRTLLAERLDGESFALLEPYLNRTVEVLSNIPENGATS